MAGWPYNTSKWQRLRIAKLAESPLCHACELRCVTCEANTVDHIKPISQGGAPFPGLSGLMSLCERCHNEKTGAFDRFGGNYLNRRFKGCGPDGNPIDPGDGWFTGKDKPKPEANPFAMPFRLKPSSIPVVLVAGPPAAGKSTYVASNAAKADLVIDLDECLAAVGGEVWGWDARRDLIRAAYKLRDEQLQSLARRKIGRAWLITSAPTEAERLAWRKKLVRVSVVVLDTDAALCRARIAADPARARHVDRQCRAVDAWHRRFNEGGGGFNHEKRFWDRPA